MGRALSDAAIKRLRAQAKLYRVADAGSGLGLAIEITPNGAKHWRLRFKTPRGNETSMSLGSWPDVTVERAREHARAARDKLKDGRDPIIEKQRDELRKRVAADATFGAVAAEFMTSRSNRWGEPHRRAQLRSIEVDLADIQHIPVAQIDAPLVLAALRKIEQRGAIEACAKARRTASQIFRYAIATGRCTTDPAEPLVGVIQSRPVVGRAAIGLSDLPQLIADVANTPSEAVTRRALVFLFSTATRSAETRGATWREIDGQHHRWVIPSARMKSPRDHMVPLSALARRAAGPRGEPNALLFPGFTAHGGLSENALNQLMIRAGYYQRQTAHGTRTLFSTWANEIDKARSDVIEACLAHVIPGVRGRYNRAQYMPQRTALLERWSAYLVGAGIEALLE